MPVERPGLNHDGRAATEHTTIGVGHALSRTAEHSTDHVTEASLKRSPVPQGERPVRHTGHADQANTRTLCTTLALRTLCRHVRHVDRVEVAVLILSVPKHVRFLSFS